MEGAPCDVGNSSTFLAAVFWHALVSPWLNRVGSRQQLAWFLLTHAPTPTLRNGCTPFASALNTSATSRAGTLLSNFAMQTATSTDCPALRRSLSSKR